ncbi:MAG: DUF1127 domain-containing protein [Dongiaceae bacterium]
MPRMFDDPRLRAVAATSPSGPIRLRAAIQVLDRRLRYRRDLRRRLAIGPHMIADIGLTPEEAQREAAKPFWRP